MGQIQQTQEHSGVTEQTSPAGPVATESAGTPPALSRVYRLAVMPAPAAPGAGAGQPVLTLLRRSGYQPSRGPENGGAGNGGAEAIGQAGEPDGVGVTAGSRVSIPGRPLVLRASCGEALHLAVTNGLPDQALRLELVDEEECVARAPAEAPTPAGAVQHCVWHCQKPGILPIYNAACTETQGSRCLLGVLIVEE